MSRTKLLLIIVLIIAIILLITFWFLSRAKQQDKVVILPETISTENQTVNLIETETEIISQKELIMPQVSEEEKLKAQLGKIISAFVERYGSYSNQSDFENLEDLLQFMTRFLASQTQQFITNQRRQSDNSAIYYGLTTKVLNTEILNFSPEMGSIKYKVSVQKNEVLGSSANANTYYQTAEVELKQEAGVWKVDSLEWQ